jgi:hypothetical protein
MSLLAHNVCCVQSFKTDCIWVFVPLIKLGELVWASCRGLVVVFSKNEHNNLGGHMLSHNQWKKNQFGLLQVLHLNSCTKTLNYNQNHLHLLSG